MATCGEDKGPVPVVLRVKRKRTEDPAEALVVNKILKLDPLLDQRDASVFQFVGTIADGSISEKNVLEHIDKRKSLDHKSLAKLNPLARLSLSDRQEQTRGEKRVSSSVQRFKLVSRLRSLNDSEAENDSSSKEPLPLDAVRNERLQLFDVVQQGADLKAAAPKLVAGNGEEGKEGESSEDGAITCNSAVMVREKSSSTKQHEPTEAYVYDLYCTEECSSQTLPTFDWSSLTAYQPQFVHDICDDEEDHLYSDDSNDESNWRNDYPEEEEEEANYGGGKSSGEEEEEEGGAHSSAFYRHRDLDYGDYSFYGDVEDHYEDGSYWSRTSHLVDCDDAHCSD